MTLAMFMAWSGCFCQIACGFDLCEHQHLPGEASCADHEHHHQHHDQDTEGSSGCEHPEPSKHTLPDPPQFVGTPLFVVQEIGKVAWPPDDNLTSSKLRGDASEWILSFRRQAYQVRLCCFII